MERQEDEEEAGDLDEGKEEFDREFEEEFEEFDEELDDFEEELDDFDAEFDEFADPFDPEGEDAKGGKSAGRPVCASSTRFAERRHTSTGTSVCVGCSRKEKEVGESCTTEGCAGA